MRLHRLLPFASAITATLLACSSPDAPLGGGGTGSARGAGGGGGGAGNGGDGGVALAQSVLGLVTFEDRPAAVDAGAASVNVVSARFLEGAFGDGGTTVGQVNLPAGCTESTATATDTSCRRIDCDQIVSTEPVGSERSAGRLTLGGVAGIEFLDPSAAGTYAPITSSGVPFWQAGGSLDVTAAGDAVPAFTGSVTAVPALTLVEPAAGAEGNRNLSRAVGFAFRTGETVQTLRLTLAFTAALDTGPRRVAFDCSAPGTSGTLTVPAELVADLPDDIAPSSGELYGEVSTSVPLGSDDAPIGRVIVSARRTVTGADQTALDWTRFVVIP